MQIGYKSNLRNSQSITDLRDGSPTSLLPGSPSGVTGGGAGAAADSPSPGIRAWGSTKERGKMSGLMLDPSSSSSSSSHRLFRSLDVSVSTTSPPPPRVGGGRLIPPFPSTDSPSPPPPPPVPRAVAHFRRWSGPPACYSPTETYTSLTLWPTTSWPDEEEETSYSCDSLDLAHKAPERPTPRKRWQSPSADLDLSLPAQSEGGPAEDQHPRFVFWELPVSSGKGSRPLVRVQPRMRSEMHPPPSHKCDLSHKGVAVVRRRTPRARSRSVSRERRSNHSPTKEPPKRWSARRFGSVQELLPSKPKSPSSFSSALLPDRNGSHSDCDQSRRGTATTSSGSLHVKGFPKSATPNGMDLPLNAPRMSPPPPPFFPVCSRRAA